MFLILDHLKELEEYGQVIQHFTWIQATCPICKGTLKISKNPDKPGAYACYSNSCHLDKNQIRTLLYTRNSFRQRSSFELSRPRLQTYDEIVDPYPITAISDSFLTTQPFQKPLQIRSNHKVTTYFDYGDFRQVRIDSPGEKKVLYTEVFDAETQNYHVQTPTQFTALPVYQARYLQPCIVIVEGEKTAAIAHKLGISAIAFPSFFLSDRYLERCIKGLIDVGVRSALILEDNDAPGRKKGSMTCKLFWKYKTEAASFNLTTLFPHHADTPGFDLYDLYRSGDISLETTPAILSEVLDVVNNG
ncbi:toprim domain-containing protein [Chroococcidiopsis sp.]|uniref:toprim domain-containing protein n=1 Tax=Chroococcidiopsis sp. TaxID=3088168 RepID=UPI003F3D350C